MTGELLLVIVLLLAALGVTGPLIDQSTTPHRRASFSLQRITFNDIRVHKATEQA